MLESNLNNFYIGMINLFLAGLWVFLPVKTSLANEAITCSELTHFDYDMTKGFYYSSDIDAERAVEVCSREHAATPDDAELNFLLGRAYRANDDSEESLVFFEKAYELGHADAAANIADSYFYGAGGHSYSTKDYFEWSKKAHDAGSLAGTFNLAHAYRDGLGVISNWSEASRLLAIASSGGLTAATLEIAENHAYGSFGQEQNQEKARDIWRRLKIDGVEQAWLNEAVFKLNQPRNVGDVLEALAELKRLAERGWYVASSELAFINMRPENYEYTENNQVKALISVDNGLNYALDVIDSNYFLTNFR